MTTLNFKDIIDKPEFRPTSPCVSNTGVVATLGNNQAAYDMRSNNYANPSIFFATSNSNYFMFYNVKNDGWVWQATSNSLNGNTGAGMASGYAPSKGPSGTLSTGNSTTSVVLSTALPASVTADQLSNRGDGFGYIIRIIGNAAGSSGKIEERRIVSNTSGTTPTIYLDSALSFTPASGDGYEILSGKVYLLTTGASKDLRSYDIATNFLSAALSTTNLPATVGSVWADMVVLDEQHVPANRIPGEGFLTGASTYDTTGSTYTKGCLVATSTAAGTITGQSSGGDASVLANEYRNFQIRIVEDVVNTTSVGQRRRITSHTAGASAVYTLASNWTVTPSTTAKFVIENDTDKIIWTTSATTTIYNYNIGANTWDTTTWAARSVGATFGITYQSFGIIPTISKGTRHSHIFSFRGSGVLYDVFDIAGAATGSWTNGLSASIPSTINIGVSGASWAYAPQIGKGDYIYMQVATSGSSSIPNTYRFSMLSGVMEAWTTLKNINGSATMVNTKGAVALYQDGNTRVGMLYMPRPYSSNGEYYECLITR